MPLEITHLEKQGILILQLKGRLTSGEGDHLLREVIRYTVGARRSRLVIDLAGVDKIDSAGLAGLLSARNELQKLGGRLALANLERSHLRVMKITQLETVLNIFGSQLDAVNSFFAGRDLEEDTEPMPTGSALFRK
jgi:anti-sigma B factor antagonist